MKIRLAAVKQIIFGTMRIAGPITTFGLGVRAGMKLKDAVEADQYQVEITDPTDGEVTTTMVNFEDLDKKQQARIMLPIILPPAVACAATITCSVLDKKCDVKHIKELNGLYTVALTSAAAYRDKLKEIKPDALPEVEDKIAEEEKKLPDTKHLYKEEPEVAEGGGDQLFVDSLSGRRFWSTMDKVKAALKKTEDEYAGEDWIKQLADKGTIDADDPGTWPARQLSLARLYENLGIEVSYLGNDLGWIGTYDKDFGGWDACGDKIDFNIIEGRNGAHYISYSVLPVEGWWEY